MAKLIKNDTVLVVLGGESDRHPDFTPSAEIMSLRPYAKELHHLVDLDVTPIVRQPLIPDHLQLDVAEDDPSGNTVLLLSHSHHLKAGQDLQQKASIAQLAHQFGSCHLNGSPNL